MRHRALVDLSIALVLGIVAGCANFAQTSALTLVTAEEAGKLAATIGAEAYKAENDAVKVALDELTAEALATRAELACGDGKAESLPAGCDTAAWAAYTATAEGRLMALEARGAENDERYAVLTKALETHAHALELAGRAILTYVQAKESGESPEVADLLVQVLAAYGTIAEALKVWGVKVPEVPGL